MNYHFSQEKKCNKKLLVFILIDEDNVQFKKVFEKKREEKRVPKKKKKRELKYPLCKKITPRRIILTIEVKIPLLDLIPLQTYRILQGIAYIHHDSIIRSLKKDPRCLETAKAPLEGALSLSLKVESRSQSSVYLFTMVSKGSRCQVSLLQDYISMYNALDALSNGVMRPIMDVFKRNSTLRDNTNREWRSNSASFRSVQRILFHDNTIPRIIRFNRIRRDSFEINIRHEIVQWNFLFHDNANGFPIRDHHVDLI